MPERPATFRDLIASEAKRYKVPEPLAFAMVDQESGGHADIQGEVTEQGQRAHGFFQLMPDTARALGVDPTDPVQNIQGGLRYLRQQLDASKNHIGEALARYHGGPDPRQHGPKTRAYVQSILSKLNGAVQPQNSTTTPSTDLDLTPDEQWAKSHMTRLPELSSLRKPPPPPNPQTLERTPAQSIVQKAAEWSVLPTLGSLAGATVGGLAGGPTIVGVPATAMAGGAAGAALGAVGQSALERAVGLETAPPTLASLGTEAAVGAAGEFGGQLAFRGIQKGLAPFAKKMTVEGFEALRALKGKVLPAQVTESRILDIGQNIAESSLFGGGGIKAFKDEQEQILEALTQKTLDRYGGQTAPEAAGQAFRQGLEGNIDTFHQYANRLYGQLDQKTQGLGVDTRALKAWAVDEFKKRELVPALSGDTSLSILKQIGQLPDRVPFAQAQMLRSQALTKARSFTDPDRDVIRGITEQVTKHVDTAMDDAAMQAGPQIQQAFRAVNAFYKSGKQKFETDFLRGLMEKHPDAIAQELFRSNTPVTIREARNAVSTKTWKPVQAALATRLVEKATNVETGDISGRAILSQLKTMGASAKEVFPNTFDEVKRLGRILATVQQRQGEGTGRMYIQLAQGGAAAGIFTGAALSGRPKSGAGAAGAILLGPAALTKIMTSPRGMRWLTTGLTAPPGTGLATRAATNLAAFLSTSESAEETEGPPAPIMRRVLPEPGGIPTLSSLGR